MFLLALVVLFEAVVCILGLVYLEVVHSELGKNLNETFLTTYKYDDAKTDAIDFIQREFKCCGVVDFGYWEYSKRKMDNFGVINKVPDSCCKAIMEHGGKRNHPSNIYYDGCQKKNEQNLWLHLSNISTVGLDISILQIFVIVFACCFYCHLKGDNGERL